MFVSFTPKGDWFVFGEDGRTVAKGFRCKDHAVNWIARKQAAIAAQETQ